MDSDSWRNSSISSERSLIGRFKAEIFAGTVIVGIHLVAKCLAEWWLIYFLPL